MAFSCFGITGAVTIPVDSHSTSGKKTKGMWSASSSRSARQGSAGRAALRGMTQDKLISLSKGERFQLK